MLDVTLYTTSWCGECHVAKRHLDELGVAYDEVDIEEWEDPRGRLEQLTGNRSVPQVVVGGSVLGGYAEFMGLVREGRLGAALGVD